MLCCDFLFCLSSSCVLFAQYCSCLWIVHSWLPLQFSLTFIYIQNVGLRFVSESHLLSPCLCLYGSVVQKYVDLKSKLIQCYYFYITFVFGFPNLLRLSIPYEGFSTNGSFTRCYLFWTDLKLFWFTYPIRLLGNQPFSFQDEMLYFSFNQLLFYHIKQKSVFSF